MMKTERRSRHWQRNFQSNVIKSQKSAYIYSIIKSQNKFEIRKEINIMAKYVCDACGWEYDEELGAPDLGIAPGTKFEDLPEDFECPLCGVGTDMFSVE